MKRLTNRGLQLILGALWILDGLLQLQPRMFTAKFTSQVIAPVAAGQPGFVSGPIHFGIGIFLTHPAIFNSCIVLVQLTIGVLILIKRTVKWGLLLSVFWGLFVWVFGEAYGSLFSGHALLLIGAPGAALIYLILSLAVMPKNPEKKQTSQVAYWLVLVWALVWIIGGIYQLLPGQNTTASISSMISTNAQSAPHWLASIDNSAARFVKGLGGVSQYQETANEMHMSKAQMAGMTTTPPIITKVNPGYGFIVLLALIQLLIGLGALMSGLWRKAALWLGIIFSLLFWVIGQNLGGFYSGLATDPNSGPLFIIMALTILGMKDLDKYLSLGSHKLENLLVGKD